MKITKSQLRQIIKEETIAILKENDYWYDSEKGYETFADRLWADNPANPDYAGEWPAPDVPDFDKAGSWPEAVNPTDLPDFELKKIRTGYLIVDKETGESVLGPFQTEDEAIESLKSIEQNPDYRP